MLNHFQCNKYLFFIICMLVESQTKRFNTEQQKIQSHRMTNGEKMNRDQIQIIQRILL